MVWTGLIALPASRPEALGCWHFNSKSPDGTLRRLAFDNWRNGKFGGAYPLWLVGTPASACEIRVGFGNCGNDGDVRDDVAVDE